MRDTIRKSVDYQCLVETAAAQHGHFTRAQAAACGYATNLIAHHTRQGNFVRIHRGVYRLRDYPSSPIDPIVAAWLAVGKERAVVSHETALRMHDLSDVIPNAIHLTVPRTSHNHPKLPNVQVHTTTRTPGPSDVVWREGLRVTSVARTIADAAEKGVGPEQIEMAIRQAIARGLTTPRRLRAAVSGRSQRVQTLTERAIQSTAP
ncbi:MAG: type IV toxin-antitoxin system AbiEi family antitoxin domain-containing protein [Thermomicrobiales bacterium]|nr:type IV toxin-antitoxin system AbiEi family antitoxin domain-containing protein [Thermomicrobiales bacterium]